VGFLGASVIAFLGLGLLGRVSWLFVSGVVAGGLLVAVVGFIDDVRSVPARYRLLAQFVAAAWVVRCLGFSNPASTLMLAPLPSWVVMSLATTMLVWLMNLTNFMDGIDGLAGSEGVTVLWAATCLLWMNGEDSSFAFVAGAAVLGFLRWNWPPAKIFMGDVGSCYLGIVLGALALHAAILVPRFFWVWLILLGCFVVDATVTLIRRVARGERFYQAHRTHAYQYAARIAGAHRPVTVAVVVINLCWLFPLAWLVARGTLGGVWGLVVAYAPLCALAFWYRAGSAEQARAPVP
jgi:Fuc2NAc and GlcNAc transferase